MPDAEPGDDRLPTDELFSMVYDELRGLAEQQLARELPHCTLSPTSLVHEAYLRLGGGQHELWENRRHFFGAAAEAMRRILVDNARRRRRQKRGGGMRQVNIEVVEPGDTVPTEDVLALSEALDRLAREEPDAAELVKLRYFAGLTMKEIADLLSISPRTADRLWVYARAHLFRDLRPG